MEKNEVYELCYQKVIDNDLLFSRKWVYEWLDKIMVFRKNGIIDIVLNYPKITIYCLVNPIDESIFYVGRTSGELKNRLRMHMANSKNGNKRKAAVILELRALGKKAIIQELEVIQPIHDMEYIGEHDREKYWVKRFVSEGQPITNRF